MSPGPRRGSAGTARSRGCSSRFRPNPHTGSPTLCSACRCRGNDSATPIVIQRCAFGSPGSVFANPAGLAAGFDKRGSRLGALGRVSGSVTSSGGTFTRRHREGNPSPRIARYRHRASMTNAMGLPNPGAEAAATTLRSTPRTSPRLASNADEDLVDVLETHALLEPHVDAVELNASCPNVSWVGVTETTSTTSRPSSASSTSAKCPAVRESPGPFRSAIEREVVLALARIAQEGGADGLTCSNTLPVRDARLATGAGGLSGRALFEGTLAIVEDMARETGRELSINASGGIDPSRRARVPAGGRATTVQVYTALIFEGPGVVGELTAGIASARRRPGRRRWAGPAGPSGSRSPGLPGRRGPFKMARFRTEPKFLGGGLSPWGRHRSRSPVRRVTPGRRCARGVRGEPIAVAVDGVDLEVGEGEFFSMSGSLRVGQDHLPADDRGTRVADRGHGPARGRGRHAPGAA